MRATHSAAESPLIEIPGVVDLYTPTLERRGYRQTAIHAYRGAVEHSWLGPRPTPMPSRSEQPPSGVSSMSISVVVIALAAMPWPSGRTW